MHFVVLLCLLAMSCAVPPAEYRDGAPLRPSAPPARYAPPGMGLPEYWGSPQPTRPQVEPGPKPKRVLPETPESRRGPGLWATRDPAIPEPGVIVQGVKIPLPDDTPVADMERARACAQGTNATLLKPGVEMGEIFRDGKYIAPDMRACHVFLAWHKCMTSKMWPPEAREGNKRLAAHAWDFFKQDPNRCHKWVDATATELAKFETSLLSWFATNYGARQ